jgi:hypothetical protein
MVRRPTREQVSKAAALLERRAAEHGLTNLRYGEDGGEIVADVAPGKTYFDIAAFELEVEEVLGWVPDVVSSGAPGARPGAPLRVDGTQAA